MPITPGLLHTYTATGNREDISDIIDMISSTQTPLYSTSEKKKAGATLHQWQYDDLRSAVTAGNLEGEDVSFTTGVQPTMASNNTQIFRREFAVTKTQEAVLKAGTKSEYKRKMANAIKELKRDVESTMWAGSAGVVTGSSAAARQAKNVMAFVTQTAGYTAGISVAKLNAGLQQVFDAGADPDKLYCASGVKGLISTLSITNLARNVEAVGHKVINRTDVFDSDFGLVSIIPDRFMTTGQALGGQFDLVRVVNLRAPFVDHLPDLGGGPRGFTETELSWEVGHPNGFSKWTGITSAS